MNAQPNETQVRAVVKGIAACADGYGHDVDLEVLANESPDPQSDFLQPGVGDRLKVFAVDTSSFSNGQQIQATLALVGGPFHERAVLRKSQPAEVKP